MKRTLLIVVSLIFSVLSASYFRFVPITDQLSLITDLLQVSSILFAILGVWVAVLDPTTLLNKVPTSEITPRSKLAMDFVPLLIVATLVFLSVVLIKFITPLLSVLLIPSEQLIPIYRILYGFVITILFLAEIWVIIGTLMPLTKVLKKKRYDNIKKENRD
ncbi:hypothetical protein [Lentibacillus sp. CBA3610]|uniref:hypothetical protein n=1 Tax=Lentibacillus sp. CBA3610 TaxID=2518176 RepID=UPI0015958D3D|nr:hypothetical protein [Lentibacillus sp. CBA3610]QKY70290.1 hypothetical protein Len3610_12420 [Lentibacillus sp. CBA3610]